MTAAANDNPLLAAAIEYARRGFSVIPISTASNGGKRPLLAWEPYQKQRATEQEIRSWWEMWPDANVGLVTGAISGFVVVDADGPEGQASLLALLGEMPATPTARTGKGLHLLFQHPGGQVGNRARMKPGLDLRGDGGFIVAPPSEHENGEQYAWLTDPSTALAPLPSAVASLLSRPAVDGAKEGKAGGEPIRNGGRNQTLYTLGRVLHARGMSSEAISAALAAENKARCIPPLDPYELSIIIKQATQQPDRPDFTPPQPEPPFDPLEPIGALSIRPALGDVAAALTLSFRSLKKNVSDPLLRETTAREMVHRLEDLHVEGATRLVQVAMTKMKQEEAREQKEAAAAEAGGGTVMELADPEPWTAPVDGAEWLEKVMALLRDYLVLPEAAAEAIALWVLSTYTLDAANIAPMLAVCSPEKRCGKSRLLTLLLYLCRRPLPASNVTGAVVYRVIEKWSPTLLIDEADTFLDGDEALRGVINSGHTRSLAKVVRTVGDDHEPRTFSTWGAKVIARIGALEGKWETAADRSIVIHMQRRAPYEQVNRSFPKETPAVVKLQRQAMRWATDHMEELKALALPEPSGLDDRAADNWAPLFNIAHAVGHGWPVKALSAALKLSGADERETTKAGTLLLEDIRTFFTRKAHLEMDRVATEDLVAWLTTEEDLADRPWRDWRRGDPINAKGISRQLEYYGVKPSRWREGGRAANIKVKGYLKASFADSWERYLPPLPPSEGPDDDGSGGQLGAGPSSNTPLPPNTPSSDVSMMGHGAFVPNSPLESTQKWPTIEGEKDGKHRGPDRFVSWATGEEEDLDGPIDVMAARRILARNQRRGGGQ
jgi:hypothetical protein